MPGFQRSKSNSSTFQFKKMIAIFEKYHFVTKIANQVE